MKYFIFVLLVFTSSVNAQVIEKFSIDSGGDSKTVGNINIIYTIGEVNVAERTVGDIQLSEGFINGFKLQISVSPKLWLQGPYLNPTTSGLMNDQLRTLDYLPTTSPYPDAATTEAAVFSITGNDAIVDWVWVELRDPNDNTLSLIGQSALLQRDGDVVATDGISSLGFDVSEGDYFVVVDHRTHMGVMTASPISLTNNVSIDFSDSAVSTFGNNARVLMPSGQMALWTGDTNNANQIRFSGAENSTNVIKDHVLADAANGFNSVTYASKGYLLIDVDLNGEGKFSGPNNDSNIIKDNILAHPGNGFNSATYIIQPTVPNN